MEKEQERPVQHEVQLTRIALDLKRRAIVFAADQTVVATVRLAREGVLLFRSGGEAGVDALPGPVLAGTEQQTSGTECTGTEREKPVTLRGKLKSKPIPGRPDSRGTPTAWARFAAHEDEREGAHLYSATFDKHTANVALTLEKDAPLTVQGYPHEHEDPAEKRLDTLSIINILEHPGKKSGTSDVS